MRVLVARPSNLQLHFARPSNRQLHLAFVSLKYFFVFSNSYWNLWPINSNWICSLELEMNVWRSPIDTNSFFLIPSMASTTLGYTSAVYAIFDRRDSVVKIKMGSWGWAQVEISFIDLQILWIHHSDHHYRLGFITWIKKSLKLCSSHKDKYTTTEKSMRRRTTIVYSVRSCSYQSLEHNWMPSNTQISIVCYPTVIRNTKLQSHSSVSQLRSCNQLDPYSPLLSSPVDIVPKLLHGDQFSFRSSS